jgi:hypothetical protein
MGWNLLRFGKRSDSVAASEIYTRSAAFERAEGSPDDSRMISAVLATEQPVPMYDWRTGKVIDEVLRADGGTFPKQVPLLDNHSRYDSASVIGSVRNIRMDGDKWRGDVHFAKNAGDRADQIWELVRQQHLSDGSVGYRYEDDAFVDIAPGQSANVRGKEYNAGKRTLRVVNDWTGREYSTTPIGADSEAKLGRNSNLVPSGKIIPDSLADDQSRSTENAEKKMPVELRKYLKSLGLRSDASEDQARAFMASLSDAQRQRGERIEVGQERFEQSQPATTLATATPATPGQSPDILAQIRAENSRADYIRSFANQVPAEQIQRAISENWTAERANQEFIAHFRTRDAGVSGHVGIHDATAGRAATRAGLQAALLMRSNVDLGAEFLDAPQIEHALRGRDANAGWIADARAAHRSGGRLSDEASRAMEVGYRLRGASVVDLLREMLDVDQVRYDRYDIRDIWTRSLTSSAVNEIFTTNFSVELLAGFVGKPDTTIGWCRESDVSNFQPTERKQMGKGAKLTRRERGQSAPHGQIDAIGESFRVYEFSQDYFIDFQDIIDDRLNAMDVTPREMGEAAAEVRPDMVYYLLMSNPTMGRDSTAVFHADHGNLSTSTALTLDGLDAVRQKMMKQTNNGRLINIMPGAIIVPVLKETMALEFVRSTEKRDTTSSTKFGTYNWAQGKFNVVSDARIDVGVTDPVTGTVQAAKTGSFWMAAEGGRYGVEVGYLQGTGRRPMMRSYVATQGRFGRGWDIQHIIGAKIIGYEGLQEARA